MRAGSIEFLGLWRDGPERAMPIKMKVDPGNPAQIEDAVKYLCYDLRAAGCTTGIVAFQSFNQAHWSAEPGDIAYQKHGYLGLGPPAQSVWTGLVHANEGIMVEGFEGLIDVLGGDWQNAVCCFSAVCYISWICACLFHVVRLCRSK